MSVYGNQRLYKCAGIDFDKNPNSKFDCKGKQVSFKEYIEKTYNKKITDNNQPLIMAKSLDDSICYLIPELFKMTGLTDA